MASQESWPAPPHRSLHGGASLRGNPWSVRSCGVALSGCQADSSAVPLTHTDRNLQHTAACQRSQQGPQHHARGCSAPGTHVCCEQVAILLAGR